MGSKVLIRVLSALIGAAVVIGLIFAPNEIFSLGIFAVICISLFELLKTFGMEKKWQIVLLNYLASIAIAALTFIRPEMPKEYAFFILFAFLTLLLICAVIWNEKIKAQDVMQSLFALVYGTFFILHLVFIKNMEAGTALIFIPLLGAWMPDTFAYFSGMLFGKHKLIPKISPNKTIEGAVGGVIGCVLMFFVYGFIVKSLGYSVAFLPLFILSVIASVVSQFGDLSASLLKRQFGVKDFGNLIPGHGGMLDRIDSLIFIAPLCYYFLSVMPIIS